MFWPGNKTWSSMVYGMSLNQRRNIFQLFEYLWRSYYHHITGYQRHKAIIKKIKQTIQEKNIQTLRECTRKSSGKKNLFKVVLKAMQSSFCCKVAN